ncbi:hypothetical protein B0H16DRAFT_1470012 [Mycena metata]|uniref:Uncharacterized protein n=1 Tax=Mycena metata TaxID=1033252 RepID=A0AAD7HVS0_9AGAR|nr:hypothetical protein B0H16DRAFT_1470012 [Mycena metata]
MLAKTQRSRGFFVPVWIPQFWVPSQSRIKLLPFHQQCKPPAHHIVVRIINLNPGQGPKEKVLPHRQDPGSNRTNSSYEWFYVLLLVASVRLQAWTGFFFVERRAPLAANAAQGAEVFRGDPRQCWGDRDRGTMMPMRAVARLNPFPLWSMYNGLGSPRFAKGSGPRGAESLKTKPLESVKPQWKGGKIVGVIAMHQARSNGQCGPP